MRRKRQAILHRALAPLAVAAVAAGVIACVLWMGSYWRTTSVRYTGTASRYWVIVDRGIVQLTFTDGDPGDQGFAWNDYSRGGYGRAKLDMFGNRAWARLGFGTWTELCLDGGHFLSPLPQRVVFLPLWAIVLATVIAPTAVLVRSRIQHHRTEANLCLVCGYDLRATADRCPECGIQLTAATASGERE